MARKVRDGWVSGVLSAFSRGEKDRFKTCARTTAYQRELSVSFHFSPSTPSDTFRKRPDPPNVTIVKLCDDRNTFFKFMRSSALSLLGRPRASPQHPVGQAGSGSPWRNTEDPPNANLGGPGR